MAASKSLLQCNVVHPPSSHLASVIFLHGSGDTGDGVRAWIKTLLKRDLQIENTKLIFPTAPDRPYTVMNGALSKVWYDRKKIAPTVPECIDTVNHACEEVTKIIENEKSLGIPPNKIVIGGFSMGGGLAYHVGYRFQHDIAGVFTLSSFINNDSAIYEVLKKDKGKPLPPLFAAHGKLDELVPYDWGANSVESLRSFGVEVEFHEFPRLYHEMGVQELRDLEEWIELVFE